uniref:Uncharacterized protein n=1 Tax=Rhizochromulina marina TaxID=1034831 RepID=A0A7S2SQR0_9STRA|mmetsp:Transcript_45/g.162  ORF Transcript_45/g.162 Transcript_45/m.162 type:complete len:817 (+) Transcript_45:1-2451(+)
MVRDLLASGGVVAIKLAQMIAEDPRVPAHYRDLLGSLRDDNDPMSIAEWWLRVPTSIRSKISELGPCLGTGSVKQVHIARLGRAEEQPTGPIAGSALPLQPPSFHNMDKGPEEYAVAVLRRNVEDEALASLDALGASDELAPVAQRLARLVFGEFNLFGEGEALGEFASTSIGRHPRFSVVKVKHHSPRCLVEERARGKTVAKVLRGATTRHLIRRQTRHRLLDDAKEAEKHRKVTATEKATATAPGKDGGGQSTPGQDQVSRAVPRRGTTGRPVPKRYPGEGNLDFAAMDDEEMDVNAALDLLVEYHKVILQAFLDDGLIHSDIHLGNAVLEKTQMAAPPPEVPTKGRRRDAAPALPSRTVEREGKQYRYRFKLFDVGQFERVAPADTKAILWTLCWISTPERQTLLRSIAIKHLAAVSILSCFHFSQDNLSVAMMQEELEQRISDAFDDAIKPFSDGTHPDKKTAFILFLRNAEEKGVSLPKSFFAIAKMIDGIVSQQESYGIEPVFDNTIETFLKRSMTWGETIVLGQTAAKMQWAKTFTTTNSSNSSSSSSCLLDLQFGGRCEAGNKGKVEASKNSRVEEVVQVVLGSGLFQQLHVLVDFGHRVCTDGAAGGGTWGPNSRKARVAAAQEPIYRCLKIWERKREDCLQGAGEGGTCASSPSHAIGATVPAQECFVGQGRPNDGELAALAHVWDATLYRAPKHFSSLLFQIFILLRAWSQALPGLVRLAPRGVDMDHVLALGAHRRVKKRRDEEGAKVLRVLQGSAPILHDKVCRILDVGQVQALCVNRKEEVHDCTVARELPQTVFPFLHPGR